MPELPEMENYKNLLTPLVIGKRITYVDIDRIKSINIEPENLKDSLVGQQITHIERKAKHLLFHLDTGNILVLHLMLGGLMFFGREEERPKRTTQIEISFGEEILYFIGLRLGYLHFYTKENIMEKIGQLGPEPLENGFTSEQFTSMMTKKRGTLKPILVDQKFISGIGNCYSDEICFHAGILPTRNVKDIESQELNKLFHSIQFILQEAISYGGYMELPLYKGDTLTGGYNPECKVYDRENEPCLRCNQAILKDNIGSRKTFFCRNCQN
jgi:formamidopyrimidine-DNA glycosylase